MRKNVAASKGPKELTHEGRVVKRLDPMQQLRRAVLANMLWEDTFYESGEAIANRIKKLLAGSDIPSAPLAALAVEARDKMKLRHMPLYLLRELGRRRDAESRALLAPALEHVIQRPDELTEFVTLWFADGRHPTLTAQAKKGLAAAFRKFNEYQLAKYNQDRAVKLRDVLFLCHAQPRDAEQDALWKRLIAGKLATPDTWEVALSADKGANQREVWERLLSERKLGTLALIRNLRNMVGVMVSPDLIRAALQAADPSRVLPFRFVAAAKYAPAFEPELEALMYKCLEGRPKLAGRTALLVDVSGSMLGTPISNRSEMDRMDAACALAILAREACEQVNVYSFATNALLVPPRRGFALRDALRANAGGSTYGDKAVAMANHAGYDRIICLTDGQWHSDGTIAPLHGRPAYMVNVASYKNGVGYGAWTSIDGWSEAILDYVYAAENEAPQGESAE